MKKSIKGVPGVTGFGGIYGPSPRLAMRLGYDPRRHSPIDYARGVYGKLRHLRHRKVR